MTKEAKGGRENASQGSVPGRYDFLDGGQCFSTVAQSSRG